MHSGKLKFFDKFLFHVMREVMECHVDTSDRTKLEKGTREIHHTSVKINTSIYLE